MYSKESVWEQRVGVDCDYYLPGELPWSGMLA